MVLGLLALGSHGDLCRHSPQKSDECTSTSDDAPGRLVAAGTQAALALAQPAWRLPADVLDGLGLCVERSRRAGCSVPARTYSGKTRCGAGVGQPTAESPRRWAGPQVAWPG